MPKGNLVAINDQGQKVVDHILMMKGKSVRVSAPGFGAGRRLFRLQPIVCGECQPFSTEHRQCAEGAGRHGDSAGKMIAMPLVRSFLYAAEPNPRIWVGAFVAVLPETIKTKGALLQAIASQLALPAYFGFNWDALFDCLRDLSWIEEHDVVLIHGELPALSEAELRIYLRLLLDSVLDWRPGEAHRFEIVFRKSDQEAIEKLLGGE